MTEIPLVPPPAFDFRNTVYSHGWCSLRPFAVRQSPLRLERTLRLASDHTVACSATASGRRLTIVCEEKIRSAAARTRIAARFATMLHFDCDLSPFYRRIRRDTRHDWMARRKAGRFLRGETFFEDVVKTILTTNCSWSLTESMNGNLITACAGDPEADAHAFPTPEAIADTSERFLRERARLGYRAPFVLELSRRCARGDIDIESFRASTATAAELHKELRSIKGIGDYAAGNLLRMLGRFEHLALDSWCRSKYAEIHANGVSVPDADIERHYAEFEEWKGLVMWLDLTRHWYSDKFPL
jgi:3-methyladenine DNA glycosylase/8-oxoguanine DNA glycosylase